MKTSSPGVEKLPSGNFRFRLQHKKKPITGTFSTEEEAAAVRAETLRQIAAGSFEFVQGDTVEMIGGRFLAARKGNRSDDHSRWTMHIAESFLGRRVPKTITRADVMKWVDELAVKSTGYSKKHGKRVVKTLSWQTRTHCRNLLKKFFEFCIDRGIATTNPVADVRIKKQDGDEDEGWQDSWYLTAADQKRIFGFTFADDALQAQWEHDKVLARVALGTGIRLGELLCLHLEDVDIASATPHIDVRFGSWSARLQRFRPPKGRAGERKTRTVPLWGDALVAMKEALAFLVGQPNEYGLVFPSKRGGRRTKAPETWLAATKKIGVIPRLGRRIWWHLLRHTCATSLLGGAWGMRWAIEDVCKVLGHSSVKVTERYAKVVRDVLTETATRAEAAWLAATELPRAPKTEPRNTEQTSGAPGRTRTCDQRLRRSPGVAEKKRIAVGRDGLVATARSVEESAERALRAIAAGDPIGTPLAVDALSKTLDLTESILADDSAEVAS